MVIYTFFIYFNHLLHCTIIRQLLIKISYILLKIRKSYQNQSKKINKPKVNDQTVEFNIH